eukprot:749905-Ditylum_brightwellii.AAC.1
MTSNLDRTPRIPAHDKPEKETNSDSTIYSFRVKISVNVPPDQSVNPREKFVTLLSMISAHFPGMLLRDGIRKTGHKASQQARICQK